MAQCCSVAWITTLEGAKRFLGERYISEFNPALDAQRLGRIFSIQTERVVAKDNTLSP